MKLQHKPVAQVTMLIRRPVAKVFEAFVDPVITTKFWFTKSSGRLEEGEEVRWDWEMYDVSTQVLVKAVEKNTRISIEWGGAGNFTTVEWLFASHEGGTLVTITNEGFRGTADEIVAQAMDSVGGFTMVLAGLKAFLEHDVILNLVADKAPDAAKAPE